MLALGPAKNVRRLIICRQSFGSKKLKLSKKKNNVVLVLLLLCSKENMHSYHGCTCPDRMVLKRWINGVKFDGLAENFNFEDEFGGRPTK